MLDKARLFTCSHVRCLCLEGWMAAKGRARWEGWAGHRKEDTGWKGRVCAPHFASRLVGVRETMLMS